MISFVAMIGSPESFLHLTSDCWSSSSTANRLDKKETPRKSTTAPETSLPPKYVTDMAVISYAQSHAITFNDYLDEVSYTKSIVSATLGIAGVKTAVPAVNVAVNNATELGSGIANWAHARWTRSAPDQDLTPNTMYLVLMSWWRHA